MKDKLFYHGLPYPFNRRIHSKTPKNISKLTRQQFERTGIELKNILRWEDDGGQINQASSAFDNSPAHVGLSQASLRYLW